MELPPPFSRHPRRNDPNRGPVPFGTVVGALPRGSLALPEPTALLRVFFLSCSFFYYKGGGGKVEGAARAPAFSKYFTWGMVVITSGGSGEARPAICKAPGLDMLKHVVQHIGHVGKTPVLKTMDRTRMLFFSNHFRSAMPLNQPNPCRK